MSGRHKLDRVLGRVKEVAGTISGNRKLKRKGQVQRGVATAKEAITDAANTAVESVKDVAQEVSDAAKEAKKRR
jgi:uncharacterized protein YjbJ (UPF0337 family)